MIKPSFEPRDIWIGVYIGDTIKEIDHKVYSIYICLLPMLPIKISWTRMTRER